MGKLVFRVEANYQEVIRLRTEIEKLKQTLRSMDSTQSPDTFKNLNVQLGESTKKMNILISEAAQAGATMENDFKKGIYDGEKPLILCPKKSSNRRILYAKRRTIYQCLRSNIESWESMTLKDNLCRMN